MLIDLFKKRPYLDSVEEDEEINQETIDEEMRGYNFYYYGLEMYNSIHVHSSKKSLKNKANKRYLKIGGDNLLQL